MKAVSPRDYYHEADKQALESLKAIPGFDLLLKKFMEIFSETQQECLNMASKVRLGPKQLPEIYNLLPPICATLGIEEPQFYLEQNPEFNAYTTGDTKPAITLHSALVEAMTEDELRAIIAHECGHIACHHVLYHTLANLILNVGSGFLGGLGELISLPLKIAFYRWNRCSELSADRAAAICLGGSDIVEDAMIRLSAGDKTVSQNINREEYRKQAENYKDLLDDSLWKKILVYSTMLDLTHPFTAVRAYEINNWTKTGQFKKIIEYMNAPDDGKKCPKCGAPVNDDWTFCNSCGEKLK